MPRPHLSPGTSHSTTKYEVEARLKGTEKWYLNQTLRDLNIARMGLKAVRATGNHEGRIVVVSEIRRLIDD